MSFEKKLEHLKQLRLNLRDKILEELKTKPSMETSEALRLLDADILFWDSQTDYTAQGILNTLLLSFSARE